MQQSFVTTTAPTVPGNNGDFDISPCKALVYAWHCRDAGFGQIPAKRPAQILAGKCEITPAGLGMTTQSSKHGA